MFQWWHRVTSKLRHMLSPGGRCFTFNVQFSVTRKVYSEHSRNPRIRWNQKPENRFVDLCRTRNQVDGKFILRFEATANGYNRGDGTAAFIIKRLGSAGNFIQQIMSRRTIWEGHSWSSCFEISLAAVVRWPKFLADKLRNGTFENERPPSEPVLSRSGT